MLIQSRKISILLSLLLVACSIIVCAPADDQEIGGDLEGQPLQSGGSHLGQSGALALFRRIGYVCPSKSRLIKIGAAACCFLTLGGISGGIGIHYDEKHPDALVIKDFEECGPVLGWNRLDPNAACVGGEENAFPWAVAHCQDEILDGCVPICYGGYVPNGWTDETVEVKKLCQNFDSGYAVFCDQHNSGRAAQRLDEQNVPYCEIPENGGKATVFVVRNYELDVVVNTSAYLRNIFAEDAMESEECKAYANEARRIAKCNGKFTCDSDCELDFAGRGAYQPSRTSKGAKKKRKAGLARSNRRRHDS